MTDGQIDNFYVFKPASGGKPKQIVILLHGVGSNGEDLISLAPYWSKYLPDAIFISPDAPFPCDMAPYGRQWFSLQDRAYSKMLSGAQRVTPIVHEFIKEQLETYELPASKLALVGFSQGTMTSLYAGPRYKEKIAGILGYSGALIWEEEAPKNLGLIPIHLIHGDADGVVPVGAYHHAREKLEKAGFAVSGNITQGLPHSIDNEGIKSGGEFLKAILS